LNFRWPYQAKVMNTLETASRMMGVTAGDMRVRRFWKRRRV